MNKITAMLLSALIFAGISSSTSSALAKDGPLANESVSFGAWQTDEQPPVDRFVSNPPPGTGNVHQLIPQTATIKNGGAVNFIIGGNHVVAIYEATQPAEIDTALLVPGITTAGGVIDDPTSRVYRGLNQTGPTGSRDRIEVVHFAKPGTYLVICALRNHFVNDGMFGFVRVLAGKGK